MTESVPYLVLFMTIILLIIIISRTRKEKLKRQSLSLSLSLSLSDVSKGLYIIRLKYLKEQIVLSHIFYRITFVREEIKC